MLVHSNTDSLYRPQGNRYSRDWETVHVNKAHVTGSVVILSLSWGWVASVPRYAVWCNTMKRTCEHLSCMACNGFVSSNCNSHENHIHIAGPCSTITTWQWRNNFSQWQHSFHWKLCCHWLKSLRQRQIVAIMQGLLGGEATTQCSSVDSVYGLFSIRYQATTWTNADFPNLMNKLHQTLNPKYTRFLWRKCAQPNNSGTRIDRWNMPHNHIVY